ncbi:hypothetical protein TNCV_3408881 [Trichonephila clavipes]|nr:hypothetical protein TNCV_3408881 [Trichonephila clavipes]
MHISELSVRLASHPMTPSVAAFAPRQSASSAERLVNQRFHLAQDEVFDSLDVQCLTPTALVGMRLYTLLQNHGSERSRIP